MLPGTQTAYGRPAAGWRLRLYEIVFESETTAGRAFDQALVVAIVLSVAVVVADSVPSLQDRFGPAFDRCGVVLHGAVHGGIHRAAPVREAAVAVRAQLLRPGGPALDPADVPRLLPAADLRADQRSHAAPA